MIRDRRIRYDNRAVGGDQSFITFEVVPGLSDGDLAVGYVLTHGGAVWWCAARLSNGEVERYSRWGSTPIHCSPAIAATFVETGVEVTE